MEQHSTAGSEDSDSDSEDAQQSISGPLKNNEMLGQITNQEMPITLDTGANVNMVPEELVEDASTPANLSWSGAPAETKLLDVRLQLTSMLEAPQLLLHALVRNWEGLLFWLLTLASREILSC